MGARAARYKTANPAGGGGGRTKAVTTDEIVDSWESFVRRLAFLVRGSLSFEREDPGFGSF